MQSKNYSTILFPFLTEVFKYYRLYILCGLPKDINYRDLKQVMKICDLCIWAISATENILSVHLVAETVSDDLLTCSNHNLHHKFGIIYPTIQLEQSGLNDSLETS